MDVNAARRRLVQALGDSSKLYFAHLKNWFCHKSSKEEFDQTVKKLLPENQQHLHNEFLLAVVTKCQTLCEPSSYTDQVKRKTLILGRIEKKPEIPIVERMSPVEIKTVTIPRAVQSKSKPLKVNFDNRFQPVEPASMLAPLPPLMLVKNPRVRLCTQDQSMPDAGMIHGRMLIAAWEAGLENGCQDLTIKMILTATRQFMKQLLFAIVTNRKGYRLRENKFIYSAGQPTLNPWLHNSWAVHDPTRNSYATTVCISSQPPQVPAAPSMTQKAERDSAFYLACSSEDKAMKPISVLDLFQTLQVKKSAIPWHSIYSVNLERISQRLYHPDSPMTQ